MEERIKILSGKIFHDSSFRKLCHKLQFIGELRAKFYRIKKKSEYLFAINEGGELCAVYWWAY